MTETADKPAMRSAFEWSREGEHALINGKYLSRNDHEKFIERIQQDAIASQRAEPQAAPDGWQLVPKEPVAKMLLAVLSRSVFYNSTSENAKVDYKAMLAAAPKPEEKA